MEPDRTSTYSSGLLLSRNWNKLHRSVGRAFHCNKGEQVTQLDRCSMAFNCCEGCCLGAEGRAQTSLRRLGLPVKRSSPGASATPLQGVSAPHTGGHAQCTALGALSALFSIAHREDCGVGIVCGVTGIKKKRYGDPRRTSMMISRHLEEWPLVLFATVGAFPFICLLRYDSRSARNERN